MSKGIIVYTSKYGTTKKYVSWLVEATNYECVETKKAKIDTIQEYDTVIFCGGIYAMGISGISFLKKSYDKLKDKKLAVFCSGASPFDPEAIDELKEHNLKGELSTIPVFYGRGAWDLDGMTFKDKMLCKTLIKVISKKDESELEPWMHFLLEAKGQSCDWSDKENLKELIEYIK